MGPWSGKAQSKLLDFYSANITEELAYQEKEKKFTLSSTRGLAMYTGEKSTQK
jgi:hypothetical protein